MRDQVKPRHFSDKDRRKGTVFLLFIQISWNNWQETTWTTLLDNDYTRLDNSNFATNNNTWFFSHEIELTKLESNTNTIA